MASIRFRRPTLAEMAIKQAWMSDPAVMSYNAHLEMDFPGYHRETGCIDFPEEEWASWYDWYLNSPDRDYCFAEDDDGELVGHAHYRVEDRVAHIGCMTLPTRRSQGLGGAILQALIERIWTRDDVDQIENDFEPSRTSAERAHRRAGFIRVDGVRLVLRRPETA